MCLPLCCHLCFRSGVDWKELLLDWTGSHSFPAVRMALLLMFVIILHLVTLAMLFISTMEKSWWAWGDIETSDLWHKCMFDNNTETWLCSSRSETDWLQAVQALMILGVVFSSISFLVFLGQLFTMSKGGLFYLTGLCQIVAGLSVFAAALIYTFQHRDILQDTRELTLGHFGFCFIMAWACVPLLMLSGVLYVHLRKRA